MFVLLFSLFSINYYFSCEHHAKHSYFFLNFKYVLLSALLLIPVKLHLASIHFVECTIQLRLALCNHTLHSVMIDHLNSVLLHFFYTYIFKITSLMLCCDIRFCFIYFCNKYRFIVSCTNNNLPTYVFHVPFWTSLIYLVVVVCLCLTLLFLILVVAIVKAKPGSHPSLLSVSALCVIQCKVYMCVCIVLPSNKYCFKIVGGFALLQISLFSHTLIHAVVCLFLCFYLCFVR